MDPNRVKDAAILRAYIKSHILKNDFLRQCTVKRIGSGTYNDAFKITLPFNQTTDIVMRLSYYDKNVLAAALNSLEGNIFKDGRKLNVPDDAMRRAIHLNRFDPVKVKNNYSLVCRYLIDMDVCPNYVYMYHYADAHSMFGQLRHMLPEKRLLQPQQDFSNTSFHELFDCNLYHALVHRLITDESELRSIVFQVIYALHILQFYLPGFRHNDLSTSNILLKLPKSDVQVHHIVEYVMMGKRFNLKSEHAFAAVWDFDLAHSPGRCTRLGKYSVKDDWEGVNLRNTIITRDKFSNYTRDLSVRNINGKFNPAFDTHFFLCSLRKAIKKIGGFKATEAFINELIPSSDQDYTDKIKSVLFPQNLVMHTYFSGLSSKLSTSPSISYSVKPIKLVFACEPTEDNINKHIESSVKELSILQPVEGHKYNYDTMS